MGDQSKQAERSTALLKLIDAHGEGTNLARGTRCACGERAAYELNRGYGAIQFYCAAHLPPDAFR